LIKYPITFPSHSRSSASLAYCVSWIMSQRLLIHLYSLSAISRTSSRIHWFECLDATREHRDRSEAVTISQGIDHPRDVSRAVRTQFEEFDQKSTGTFNLTVPDIDEIYPQSELQQETGVQVRIERIVKLDRRLRTFELENYSRSSGGRSGDITTEH
jgi:hypothetical protein